MSEDAATHARHAKRLRTKPYVTIWIGHRFKVPGFGASTGWQKAFSAPIFEAALINLRAHLKDQAKQPAPRRPRLTRN